MRTMVTRLAVPVAVVAGLTAVAAPALAVPKAVKYTNCTALNKVYKHGVAKAGAKDRTSGSKPVTTFMVYTATYQLNTHLDRDKDGVACEKK